MLRELVSRTLRRELTQPVRFVTSFNEVLYEASGRRGVTSFRRHNPDYELLAYVEASQPEGLRHLEDELRGEGVEAVRLVDLPMLEEFLALARDVIPSELGGEASAELFPGEGPSSGNVWFRKQMFRWFRKVVALEHASRDFSGLLFWLDCDCFCTKSLPPWVVRHMLDGADICFAKGRRAVTETGFVGFDLGRPATRALLEALERYYLDQEFRSQPRWDDSYALDFVRARIPKLRGRDLAGGRRATRMGHILRRTIVAPFIEHEKGLHGRKLEVVR